MLNNFVIPTSISSGQAVEGVQPIQGFAPYNQLTELMPTFKLAEDGSKPEDEEKKDKADETQSAGEHSDPDDQLPEIFKLAFNVSFREMIDYFLVPDHEKILDIQSKMRQEREINELTIFAPAGSIPTSFEGIRDQLYEFQMQLFETPKGLHCHIIL